jgi:hypothetical protein
VAERQGQLMVDMVQAALREVDLSLEQAVAFEAALARQARELTAAPVGRKQLGGHLFCTRRACDLVWGTTTPDHLYCLPRKPRRETSWRVLTSTSSSEWSVLVDVRDRLAEFPWRKQREILEAVVRHRYVAVKSAHDTGKGHGASRAVAWWFDTREDPFATTTAPTTKQVNAILWRTSAGSSQGNLPGRITLDDE